MSGIGNEPLHQGNASGEAIHEAIDGGDEHLDLARDLEVERGQVLGIPRPQFTLHTCQGSQSTSDSEQDSHEGKAGHGEHQQQGLERQIPCQTGAGLTGLRNHNLSPPGCRGVRDEAAHGGDPDGKAPVLAVGNHWFRVSAKDRAGIRSSYPVRTTPRGATTL